MQDISTVGLLSQTKIEDVKVLFDTNYFSMLNIIQKISKKNGQTKEWGNN